MAKRKIINEIVRELLFDDDLGESSEDDEDAWLEDCAVVISCLFSRQKRKKLENYLDVVNSYSEAEFLENFRLHRPVVEQIISEFEESSFFPPYTLDGTSDVSAEIAVLMFLWFAGNKATLRDIGGCFGVCPATVYRYNERVMDFLISIASDVIKLPEDKEEMAKSFERTYGFSDVLGVIDGTHIRIRTPKHKDRTMYTDRDKQTSLGLQVVCDSHKRFIDVCTGMPGRTHDATMFSLSTLSEKLPGECGERYHLIGDSAYTCQQNLITPYSRKKLSREEIKFNKRFSQMRVLVENSINRLKNIFRGCTNIEMHDVDKMSKFIISCCVLHNLRIDKELIIERDGEVENWTLLVDVDPKVSVRIGKEKRNDMKIYINERI